MPHVIHVIKNKADPTKGVLHFQNMTFNCALGKGGVLPQGLKKEGDGATPAGLYSLRRLYMRSDKIKSLITCLDVTLTQQNMGWCDDVASNNYNMPIIHPFAGSAEHLWRDDDLYDIVIETSHNSAPVIKGAGSCIFMHVARDNYSPTHGCVALAKADLIELLKHIGVASLLRIYP